ncbi:hypothetical protein EMPS_02609 [Entomortierella parvispora]|uniref:Uncharacterized protein n=1 Tax=Entomortierella parvispora TaxID=205924 RepID=A0A9P3H520_9FUNG|nr:hypothetical protein EMPS_02609 [Entomortierella parvispora]
MFHYFQGNLSNPDIPVRIPNDDTSFDPKEYPNVVFVANGKLAGKIQVAHSSDSESDNTSGLISVRVWVMDEKDKNEVTIKPSFNNKTFTLVVETPAHWGVNTRIYHETLIQYPTTLSSTESLSVESPLTSFNAGEDLSNLFIKSLKGSFSNSSVSLKSIYADRVQLRTQNGNIEGEFRAGHVDLKSSNGPIHAKLILQDALDDRQSTVRLNTSNASIDTHISTINTARGLRLDTNSNNGRLIVGALLAKADRASWVNAVTNNGKVECNIDASLSGQPLEVKHETSNGSIVSSIMVPVNEKFKGFCRSSNASVEVNLTEAFHGRFEVDTSNASSAVEGTELTFEQDKKTTKYGHRGDGQSEIKVQSSNGRVSLRFYETGKSTSEP